MTMLTRWIFKVSMEWMLHFIVSDLTPYLDDEQVQELRTIPFEEREDDPEATTSDSIKEDGQEVILSRTEMEDVRSIGFHGRGRNEGHCCISSISVQSYE